MQGLEPTTGGGGFWFPLVSGHGEFGRDLPTWARLALLPWLANAPPATRAMRDVTARILVFHKPRLPGLGIDGHWTTQRNCAEFIKWPGRGMFILFCWYLLSYLHRRIGRSAVSRAMATTTPAGCKGIHCAALSAQGQTGRWQARSLFPLECAKAAVKVTSEIASNSEQHDHRFPILSLQKQPMWKCCTASITN